MLNDALVYRCGLFHYTVFRQRYACPALEQLLLNPDASFAYPGARLLKDGNTCTVWSTPVADRELVVKRYNIKGFAHGMLRAVRRSRAAGSWRNALRLEHYGIATAPPVALIEQRWGMLRRRAYFISERVPGQNCFDFFDGNPASREEHDIARSIVDLLAELARHRISHGDMKASNIIIGEHGPVIIDLDSLREHRGHRFFLRDYRRDMRRFLQNWENRPRIQALFQRALNQKALAGDALASQYGRKHNG